MIQANGGNDTIDITGSITESTVYGGQGTDYISGVDGANTINKSLIEGNLGADSLILGSTTSVFNTEIYGSSSAGTDTDADSIVVGARTIQTSTVYGGAGADTLILGESLGSGQFVETDFRAFAGNDSVAVTGSFVSTTVRAGSGNDTIFISGRTVSEKALPTLLSMVVTELIPSRLLDAVSPCTAVAVLIQLLMVLTPSASPTFIPPLFTVQLAKTASC